MIAKSSQRGGGQDLATHLLNAFDNEHVEVAEVRGAVADDLHGAFAEWKFHADALTRCENYLYSLSVNPDPEQGPLGRAQYLEFADRAERRLGLEGQPRAIVFHVKHGREHCHVVWSRIDTKAGKAIHQSYDHEALMGVVRRFARDHGLALPDGMASGRGDRRRQASLYEKRQESLTGLTTEERVAQVTDAWRRSDGPRAFVGALEQLGYVLATGKRAYVLVDIYGTVNALPRLIDDRTVRTRDLRAFLARTHPPESLPTVEEAKALAAQRRQAVEDFARVQRDEAPLERLKRKQAVRRDAADADAAAMRERHRLERAALAAAQAGERSGRSAAHLAETRRVRRERAAAAPKGLAAFLGRVTGVALAIRKLHRHRDRRRLDAYRAERQALDVGQRKAETVLLRRQDMQALEAQRNLRVLDQAERRELKAFHEAELCAIRVRQRRGDDRPPSFARPVKRLDGTMATPPTERLPRAIGQPDARRPPIDLTAAFAEASGRRTSEDAGERGSGSEEPKPRSPHGPRRQRTRSRGRGR